MMATARALVASLPLIPRLAVVCSITACGLGGLVGLVLGLRAYPPTAWFAVFEVAIPAGILGAVLGALVGVVAVTVQRISHKK
jgi:hypothetical protein